MIKEATHGGKGVDLHRPRYSDVLSTRRSTEALVSVPSGDPADAVAGLANVARAERQKW